MQRSGVVAKKKIGNERFRVFGFWMALEKGIWNLLCQRHAGDTNINKTYPEIATVCLVACCLLRSEQTSCNRYQL